jgi:hypothetical protein
MARRRSILGDLCLQLSLQAAFAVSAATAAHAAEAMLAERSFLGSATDDSFVLTGVTTEPLAAPTSFEDFSLAFYLPFEAPDPNDYYPLPDLDAALLGGPEHTYNWHSDDLLL